MPNSVATVVAHFLTQCLSSAIVRYRLQEMVTKITLVI